MMPEKLNVAVPLPWKVVVAPRVIGALTLYVSPLVPEFAARFTVGVVPTKLNEPPLTAVMLIVSTAPDEAPVPPRSRMFSWKGVVLLSS